MAIVKGGRKRVAIVKGGRRRAAIVKGGRRRAAIVKRRWRRAAIAKRDMQAGVDRVVGRKKEKEICDFFTYTYVCAATMYRGFFHWQKKLNFIRGRV